MISSITHSSGTGCIAKRPGYHDMDDIIVTHVFGASCVAKRPGYQALRHTNPTFSTEVQSYQGDRIEKMALQLNGRARFRGWVGLVRCRIVHADVALSSRHSERFAV